MLKKFFGIENDPAFFIKLAVLALFMRFCIGAAYYNYFIAYLKTPVYAFDGEAYSIVGWYIALVLKGVNFTALPSSCIPNDYSAIGGLLGTIATFNGSFPPIGQYGVGIYSYLIGIFYYIFGYAPVLLRFVMGGVSVATAFVVYALSRNVFNENIGRISFVIALFMPSFVLYSASLQRDTLINFLTIFLVYQILQVKRDSGYKILIKAGVFITAGLILLYYLRINTMLVLILFIAVYLFTRFAVVYRWIAAASLLMLFVFPPLTDKIMIAVKAKLVLLLNYHRGLSMLGGSTFKLLPDGYYNYALIGTGGSLADMRLLDIIPSYFKGLAAFFLEPSPISLTKVSQVIVLPQIAAWYFVLIFAVVGIYTCFRSMTVEKFSLMVVAFIFASTIGMSEANYETLIRHRDMIVPVFIVFAAYGLTVVGKFKKGTESI